MTFYKTIKPNDDFENAIDVEIEVLIPRRSLYLISRTSRTDWMHGIKAEHIIGRRMVCTLREIGEEFGQQNE